jgi:hypothetical protein
MASLGQRNGQAARARGKFEDGTAGPVGQGEIEVEIARILVEVEIVESRKRSGGLRIGPAKSGRSGRVDDLSPPSGFGARRAGVPRAR